MTTVQSISDTASVMSPSSVTIGFASFTVVSLNVHPVIGCTRTDAIGVSVGSCTFSPVVLNVSLSVGTRKVMIWSPPPRVAPGRVDGHVRPGGRGREQHQPDGTGRNYGNPAEQLQPSRTPQCRTTVAVATVESNWDVRTLSVMTQLPVPGSSTELAEYSVVDLPTAASGIAIGPSLLGRVRRGRGELLHRRPSAEIDREADRPGPLRADGDLGACARPRVWRSPYVGRASAVASAAAPGRLRDEDAADAEDDRGDEQLGQHAPGHGAHRRRF